MKAALLSCAALCSLPAAAQSLSTGYFSEGYIFRHQQNPAFGASRNYVALPAIGSLNVDFGMNMGVKNFIFEQPNGKLTTFMNSSVNAAEFLGDLPDKPQLNINTDINILSAGFRAFGGYNTVEVGAHMRGNATISKDLFAFMKEMRGNTTYNFSDLEATAMGWADIAIGHSRNITKDLRVGAKAKLLVGIGYLNANLSGTNARLGDDKWVMNVNGTMDIAGGGEMTRKKGTNEMSGYEDFTPGMNGMGVAFDLGVTYDMKDLVPGLSLSAAVTDLGSMKWDCARAGATNKQFSFEGFNKLKIHESEEGSPNAVKEGNIEEQWEGIREDLEDVFKLNVLGDSKQKANIGATLHAGIEYKLPAYDKIKFGALYTQRISDYFAYTEGRLVVNYAPIHAIDIALSGNASNYGMSAGALVNFNCPGFHFFLGIDRMYVGSVNSDMIPLEKGSMSFATGINVTFGKWK